MNQAIDDGDYKFVGSDFKVEPKATEGWEMQKVNKYTGEVADENPKISTFEGFIRAYIHQKLNKKSVVGKYKLTDDGTRLVYEGEGRKTGNGQDVLVLKLKDGRLIGNASKLNRCGSFSRGDEAPAQRVMFDLHNPQQHRLNEGT